MHEILNDIQALADPQKAKDLARFFKTGPGEYGEGDRFLGITVPLQRQLVGKYWKKLTLNDVTELLRSKYHECRMIALLILVRKYKKGTEAEKREIFSLYMDSTRYINNWDLVDLSARDIVGAHYFSRNRAPLHRLAASTSLWERRIAMISTFYFIGQADFADSLKIAESLLGDRHDLIHKAVGWVLREIGKRDLKAEEEFLKKHYVAIPRTALRYAIERFPEEKRQNYLKGSF